MSKVRIFARSTAICAALLAFSGQVQAQKTVYFIMHGVGADVKDYIPKGKFFEAVKSSANGQHLVSLLWHQENFIRDVGQELLKQLQHNTPNAEAIRSTIQARLRAGPHKLLPGASMIERTFGAYALSKEAINAVVAGNKVVFVGNSFGGHVAGGASQMCSEIATKDLITPFSVATIASPLLNVTNFSSQLKKKCPKNCLKLGCGLLGCCIEDATDFDNVLEGVFPGEVAVWNFCRNLVQTHLRTKFVNQHPKPLINTIVLIGTPIVPGAFIPSKEVERVFNLFSEWDFVADTVGNQTLRGAVNLQIKIPKSGWLCCGSPNHPQIVGHPWIGNLIPQIVANKFPRNGLLICKKNRASEYRINR